MSRKSTANRMSLMTAATLLGVAPMLLIGCEDKPDDLSDVADSIGDALDDAADSVDDAVDDMADAVDDAADDAADAVKDAPNDG